jgi:hypothetical protein
MRIASIKINPESNLMTIGDRQLRGVILTVLGLFGKREIKAFPTNYGIPGTSGRMIFYYFCDEKGKELSTNVSQQINNFLLTTEIIKEDEIKNNLPTDEETQKWFDENIAKDCSASSAIYKFRLWLKERQKNG